MAHVTFTANIQRHVACPPCNAAGATVREVLENVFAQNARARGYVLNDQGGLHRHMVVFVNGAAVRDRTNLTDAVTPDAEVCIMQALSGG